MKRIEVEFKNSGKKSALNAVIAKLDVCETIADRLNGLSEAETKDVLNSLLIGVYALIQANEAGKLKEALSGMLSEAEEVKRIRGFDYEVQKA